MVSGRLSLEEFSERLERAQVARTDREARLAGPEVELDIYNLFGTVTVLVPAGVQLEVEGSAPFASQVIEPPSRPPPAGAPRLRIRASGPGGTLYVRAPEPG